MRKLLYALGSFIIILLIGINALFYYENMYIKKYIPVSEEVSRKPQQKTLPKTQQNKNTSAKNNSLSVKLKSQPKEYKASLFMAGDVFFNGYLLKSYYDRQSQNYVFGDILENVKDITYADLSIFKFDSTITDNIPVSTYGKYNAPKEALDVLKSAGFNLAVLSSSHIFDGKVESLKKTINNLKEAKIETVGVKLSQEDHTSKFFDINNIRIGVAAFTKELSSVYLGGSSTYKDFVSLLDKDEIQNEIEYLKGLNCDIIIAYANWGVENSNSVSFEQKEFAKELIKNGVDIVIGTHTHTIQPFEKVKVEDESGNIKEGIVFYSLGNFLCDQTVIFPYNRFGLTVRLDLVKKENKLTKKISVEPIYIFRKTRRNASYYDFIVLKAKDILNRTDIKTSYINYAKKLLEDVDKWLKNVQ
ncbi:poly-gamma-glutamate synthesis protein (capsule biosynthesis protein) [Caldicellulosiruptor bescii]|uniref:CapA family protein n=1 Tax=Caldicellulosiruptor bescii TaxID=31899 RepID=UPI0009A7EAED|nr:CapA family protein [Caldicellulosiruptor bescii]PBC88063.1 poly-gamma-glutamate synthesis protein (capsule biosynthesis protein) [Caldicellulosiruptor bescii]PBC90995.1 poly-gamma-glutamate synthesis protein (capsule biosynthesis protein) [Caldicellulosiruptor bescii]PBD03572.1 poly-gamma-glutamate synthesis protein (capsule biosynthesis protein) [Caldicellulosiruptor bescii]PBD06793.1 poly-gamma-glutamate synthesis protein (capsule biosynthesis protein) [Caldicellulosiruptor bescii]PBD082